MTRHIRMAISVWALVTGAPCFTLSVGAQGKSVNDGVYSDAQAKRGTTLYAEQCASCHGENLEGVADLFPALTGDAFGKTWQGKSVGELVRQDRHDDAGARPWLAQARAVRGYHRVHPEQVEVSCRRR